MSQTVTTIPTDFSVLEQTVQYALQHSPYYKSRLAFLAGQQLNRDVFRQIPFTSKEDLSEHNRSFLAVPMNEVAEFVTTSGTSGEPVTIYLTKQDLRRLASNEQESLLTTGAGADDIFQLMTTIDRQFMAGLAYYLGVQEIGAGMIRIGPGVPALQWKSILQNQPTVLIAVPSFIITLIDFAKNNGIDFSASSVRKIVCIGEPIREDDLSLNILGRRITDDWNIELYSTYASTEMGAAFTECEAQQGGHLNPSLLHLEVLREDDSDAPDGELGEIVITTLGTTGTPLIRYRTGDLARIYTEPCTCGRKTPRIGPILGRKNQMIKFKGTTLFPNAIYEIFDGQPEVSCYKIEVSKDYLGNDAITVLLEKHIEGAAVMSKIVDACQAKLRVVPHFVFLESDYLRGQVFKKHMRKPEKIVFK